MYNNSYVGSEEEEMKAAMYWRNLSGVIKVFDGKGERPGWAGRAGAGEGKEGK